MSDGASRPAERLPGEQWNDVGGREPQRHPEPDAGVGQCGGGDGCGGSGHATSLPQAAMKGRAISTRSPTPGRLTRPTDPPATETIAETIASPRPAPVESEVRTASRANRSKA